MTAWQGPQKMNQRHWEIVAYGFLGWTAQDIGAKVGMHPQAVATILRSPLVQGEIAKLRAQVNQGLVTHSLEEKLNKRGIDLEEVGVDAIETGRALMQSGAVPPQVRASLARHLSDRIVFKEKDEQESSYREILRRLDAMERGTAPILNVDGENVQVNISNGHAHVEAPALPDAAQSVSAPSGDGAALGGAPLEAEEGPDEQRHSPTA